MTDRPLDVREIAAGILDRVERSGAWASRLLEQHERRFTDRRDRGPYRQVDELTRVRGIGERTLERLRPFIRVGRRDQSRRAARAPPRPRAPPRSSTTP